MSAQTRSEEQTTKLTTAQVTMTAKPPLAKPDREAYLREQKVKLQKFIIAKQLNVVKSQQERVRIQTLMSKDEKWLANSAKRTLLIVGVLLISIAIWLAVRIISISRKYSTMIHLINEYGPADMPANIPFASRGFNCAVACDYPALTGLLGYLNGGFPYAMYISVYSSSLSACFMKDPKKNITVMWSYSQIGENNVKAGSTTASLAIVCRSWGFEAGVTDCFYPCPPDSCPKWYDYATTAVGTLNTGVMIGSFFPPFGTLVGAAIGAAAGIGMTAASSSNCSKNNSNCIPVTALQQ